MSLFSTIFKYSAAQLNYQSPVYHISYNTYEHTLPKIKPSLVPERTYNTLSDDIFNTLGDSNRDFLNTPYEITADTDYNSYVSKVIDKFAFTVSKWLQSSYFFFLNSASNPFRI